MMSTLFFIVLASLLYGGTAFTSLLWGHGGSSFDPTDRLLDYSFAGVRGYERASSVYPISDYPWVPAFQVVTTVNPTGDGTVDAANIQSAVDSAAEHSIIMLGAGTFNITQQILITKRKGIVLRGQGPYQTYLNVQKPLNELIGGDRRYNSAYIQIRGSTLGKTKVGDVIGVAERGTNVLTVKVEDGITMAVDDFVRITQRETPGISGTVASEPSLINHICGMSVNACNRTELGSKPSLFQFVSRVVQVSDVDTDGNIQLRLERALPLPVRAEWLAEMFRFEPDSERIGVEELTIDFVPRWYKGHTKEEGANGIELMNTVDSWVKNVRIISADVGVLVRGDAQFNTFEGLGFQQAAARVIDEFIFECLCTEKRAGHHAFKVDNAADNLFHHFFVDTPNRKFWHDISIDWYASRNVFASGSGDDLNIDGHRAGNWGNLFTNITFGLQTRPFDSSGNWDRGPHMSYGVFWGIGELDKPLQLPSPSTGVIGEFRHCTWVATPLQGVVEVFPKGLEETYVEVFDPWKISEFTPKNLFLEQLQAREGTYEMVSTRTYTETQTWKFFDTSTAGGGTTATPKPTAARVTDDDETPYLWIGIGGGALILLLLCLIIVVIFYFVRRNRHAESARQMSSRRAYAYSSRRLPSRPSSRQGSRRRTPQTRSRATTGGSFSATPLPDI